jgi:hypothetical protein
MVDYNIAIPQQQLFQAPDFTQNAMRMQQAQLQEMQMQELARKSAAARNTQQLYADPNFDQFSPEGIRRLALAGGPKVGIAAATGARQNEQLLRQTAATNAGLEKTYQDLGVAKYTEAQNSLAAIAPGDAEGYVGWYRVHGPAYRANGVNLPTPEQWAQDPTGKLQAHMVSTSQTVRERAARAPVYRDFGGTTLRVDPDNPDVLIEPSIRRAGAPQPGAGTGPAIVPMSPSKVAEMQATQARVGETVTPFSAAGANAAVNNMPGVPVPDAGAKNAMRAGPIGAGDFARQQQEEADKRAQALELAKQRQTAQVARQEAVITKLPQVEETATEALRQIDDLIGGGTVDDKGRLVYAKGAKPAHPGFESAVGMSLSKMTGGPIPGSNRSNFEERFKQTQGGAFLEAFNMLRGGGAIDRKEGEKATAARTRMSLNQSGPEFVTAAREYADIIKNGMARAREMAKNGTWPSSEGEGRPLTITPSAKPAERQISRTGMLNGRRVVQYSDGATEYAD